MVGNTCAVVRELIHEGGIGAGEVAGVGITGMVPALVLLDEKGTVLRRSIQQNDARTAAEIDAMAAEMDADAFFRLTGGGYSQQLVGPRLRWLETHEPETFSRVATAFGSYDYITHRLTGARTVERNWALESGLMALDAGAWDDRLLALGHARAEFLPPIRDGHEVVGGISAEAAAETGLAEGTPVVAGCADHVASAWVAGVVDEGDVLVKFGGAGDILVAADTARPDPRLFIDHHMVPGLFLTNGCMAASGSVLKWVACELAGGLDFAALDRLAADIRPGAEGLVLLPYFLGEKTPLHDPHARGTLIGLGLHHGIAHIWRAALEAVVMGFRHHMEVFAVMDLPVRRVVASNGGALSDVWLQVAADGLGQPVRQIERHPGSCLGAAYLAALGTGAEDDWSGVSAYVAEGREFAPDPVALATYDKLYPLFRETYEQLKPLYPRLAGI